MVKILMLSMIALLGLAACSVTPGQGSKIVLKDGTTIQSGAAGGNGQFCPPGQAKKGRC